MNEKENEVKKPTRLTLSHKTLSLNKDLQSSVLKNNFVNRNEVTIEVKKNQASSPANRKINERSSDGSLTSSELTHRLSVLKKAQEDAIAKKTIQKSEAEEQAQKQEDISQNDINQSSAHFVVEEEQISVNFTSQENQSELSQDLNNSLQESQIKEEKSHQTKPNQTFSETKEEDVKSDSKDDQAKKAVKDHKSKPGKKQDVKSVDLEDEEDSENAKIGKKKASDEAEINFKAKVDKSKKINKTAILHMLDSEDEDVVRKRSLASIKRAKEKERRKNAQNQHSAEKIYREVILPETIAVGELANRMSERVADVIRELMKLGIIANSTQMIDADTAELVISTLGHTVKRVHENQVENIFDTEKDNEEDLLPRAPIVTVMGHVDHGKTSLLDALKSTDVAAGEVGGITQHIGAYRVNLESGNSITFIDTPGHEAFTEMRNRGAEVTDIVILVVAADDGVKAQTVEAINHAKVANVPIIVAVNKIDKPGADSQRVKQELLQYGLVCEEFGGDVMSVEISALKKMNLDKLEEAILLVSEMMELKANPSAAASGVIIESKVDKGRGILATVLVQRGTLRVGDIVVAGTAYGKVRMMYDHKGKVMNEVLPSVPVEILGFDLAPMSGEKIAVVSSEKQARDIVDYRLSKQRETIGTMANKVSLEDLFAKASGENLVKELTLIIKGDVNGSVEAINVSLAKLSALTNEVKVKVVHSAVGAISESDVSLAEATRSIILGFNVRANNNASLEASKNKVDIRYYSIIYDLIDDIKSIMSGMLKPIIREEYIGSVEIRQIFNISKIGKIAGSYVTRGRIKKGSGVRLIRDNIVVHEGKLKTLKRFKDEVKEVAENYECGIAFEGYDNIQVGDMVEVFEIISQKQEL